MSELPSVSTLRTVGEHVELELGQDLASSPRYNDDIAPTKAAQRTWSKWNVASLWVGMAICVPTYTLGGVLTAYFGLSVSEALWTILIANIVVLIPLTLNAYPGTRYGIPCPVVLRSSFGIIGSNLPSLIRAIVACGWFGVQTLFGGIAIHLLLSALIPGWAELGGKGEVIGFFIFWTANITVVIRGSESIKLLEALAAPLLLIVAIGLMAWALPKISMSEVLAVPANRPADAPVFGYFMAGLTAMVGFWATLSLNIPDFSRFAKSQRAQIAGQIIGLPLTMFLFAGLGVVLTAASADLVGHTISDPINLIGEIAMFNLFVNRASMFVVAICLTLLPVLQTANAAIIQTEIAIEIAERQQQIDHINEVLARDAVQSALIRFGVDPVDASTRIQSLTNTELQVLEQQLANLPAGGTGFVEVIGIVAIVLLVLELLNVTNFFAEF